MISNPFVTAAGLGRYSPTNWIKYFFWALLGFVMAWCKSRRIVYLLLGLPAIVSVVVLAAASAKTGEAMPRSVRLKYLASTTTAIDELNSTDEEERRAELVGEAEFYLQRLEEGGDTSEERLWQRVRLDAAMGRSQRRWEDLQAILSDQEQSRDAEAHLEIARGLLLGEWESPDAVETAESHLQKVIGISTSQGMIFAARRLLAELYRRLDRLEDARDQLEPIAGSLPEERLRLATVYRDMDDKTRAASHAALAVPHFLERIENDSTDPRDWQQLADAYFLAGEYPAAIDVLQRAMSLPGHELEFRRMQARFYVVWLRELPESDIARRLELLELAMEAYPSDNLVLGTLHEFLMTSDDSVGDQIEARLLEVLETGEAPAAAHMILGTRAAMQGDAERAQLHLNIALQQGEMTPHVLNNLAHVLAFGPARDYDTALVLIDQALSINSHPRMHETRGQILARMQRWPDAIAALETALRNLRDYAPLHQTLAEAYDAVGRPELAEIHRRRLEELGGPVTLDFANSVSHDPEAEAVLEAGPPQDAAPSPDDDSGVPMPLDLSDPLPE